MESLLRALDRADGVLQACRLMWPGHEGRFLRLGALLATLLLLVGLA